MKRRFRILRIWWFGKLLLAKKVRVRIVVWAAMTKIMKRERGVHYTPKHFNDEMNKAQLSYFEKMFSKRANNHN